MAKWRQMWDEVEQKYKMVAIDKSAAARDGISLHAAFDPFVSPVDGSVISDRKENDCITENILRQKNGKERLRSTKP